MKFRGSCRSGTVTVTAVPPDTVQVTLPDGRAADLITWLNSPGDTTPFDLDNGTATKSSNGEIVLKMNDGGVVTVPAADIGDFDRAVKAGHYLNQQGGTVVPKDPDDE